MPRYHFHIHAAVDAPDREGIDLPDLAAATRHAVAGVRHLMRDDILAGHICLAHAIEIADGGGTCLHVVRYGDGIVITGRP